MSTATGKVISDLKQIEDNYLAALTKGNFEDVKRLLENSHSKIDVSKRFSLKYSHDYPLCVVIKGLAHYVKSLKHSTVDNLNCSEYYLKLEQYLNIVKLLVSQKEMNSYTINSVFIIPNDPNKLKDQSKEYREKIQDSTEDFVVLEEHIGDHRPPSEKTYNLYDDLIVIFMEVHQRKNKQAMDYIDLLFKTLIEAGADFEQAGKSNNHYGLKLISGIKQEINMVPQQNLWVQGGSTKPPSW